MTSVAFDTVDRNSFRQGMARLAASVTVITTDGPAGRHGLTATATCSVTDTPPTLLVCVNRNAGAHDVILRNGVLCVNLLSDTHESLSGHFGGGRLPLEERFAGGEWTTLATGAPALEDAAVSFDCAVSRSAEIGTHTVIFCEVRAMRLRAASPVLVYGDRAYHRVGGTPALELAP